MTALSWLVARALRAWGLAVALGYAALALAAGLDLAARRPLDSGAAALAALGRAGLSLRELVPVLVGLSVALLLSRARERGELLALGCAGLGPRALWLAVALGVGLPGLGLALALEAATPALRDGALEAEARAMGRSLSLTTPWAALPEGLLRVGAPDAEGRVALTWAQTDGGRLTRRLDLEGARWTEADGWEARARQDRALGEGAGPVQLPDPRALAGLLRRLAPAERALQELPPGSPWRTHRLAALGAPLLASLLAAGLTLATARLPSATSGACAALLTGWLLGALVLAESAVAGWGPLAALGLGALWALRRPVAWAR